MYAYYNFKLQQRYICNAQYTMFILFPMLVSSIAGARMALDAHLVAIHAKQKHNPAGAGDIIDVEARFIDDVPEAPMLTTITVMS